MEKAAYFGWLQMEKAAYFGWLLRSEEYRGKARHLFDKERIKKSLSGIGSRKAYL